VALRTQKVLNVFLASPGDLQPERKVAADVIDALNRAVVRSLGWHVELLGWEDTLPGFARPQEKINEDVDACDLFIGLLWERWGLATGEYSSGFEEEFERARRRRINSGEPEMWLFLKEIDSARASDPGPQLQKVLTFRQARIDERDLLFKEFSDTPDWQAKLWEYLTRYLLDREGRQVASVESETAPPEPMNARVEPLTEVTPSVQQAIDVLESYQRSLGDGATVPRLVGGEIDQPAVARMYLLSASSLAAVRTGQVLGVHEANFLYGERDGLQLSPSELLLVLRTLLEAPNRLKPGWYWFQSDNQNALKALIADTVVREESPQHASRMVDALSRDRFNLSTPEMLGFVNRLLARHSEPIAKATINFVTETGLSEAIPALATIPDTFPSLRRETERGVVQLLALNSPAEALQLLLANPDAFSDRAEAALLESASDVPYETAVAATSSTSGSVRALGLKLLDASGSLTEETVMGLLNDEKAFVRGFAVRYGLEHGWKISERDVATAGSSSGIYGVVLISEPQGPPAAQLWRLFMRRQDDSKLEPRCDLYTDGGSFAYEELALRGVISPSQVRSDLTDGFARFSAQSRGHGIPAQLGLRPATPTTNIRLYSAGWQGGSNDAAFHAAGLRALLRAAEPADAAIARKYLHHSHEAVQLAAVELLARTGTSSDVEALVSLRGSSLPGASGSLVHAAGRAALALGDDLEATARVLVDSGQPGLVRFALEKLVATKPSAVRSIAEPLLSSDDPHQRRAALDALLQTSSIDDVKGVLATYEARPRHFYDVVATLDAALYGPGWLRRSVGTRR
jgi:hypothetical protein